MLKKQVAVLSDRCLIEDAEVLLEWLLQNPKGKLNAKSLTYMHTAILQVIIACKPAISLLPEEPTMGKIFQLALKHY